MGLRRVSASLGSGCSRLGTALRRRGIHRYPHSRACPAKSVSPCVPCESAQSLHRPTALSNELSMIGRDDARPRDRDLGHGQERNDGPLYGDAKTWLVPSRMSKSGHMLPDGSKQHMTMLNTPVFGAANPDTFNEMIIAA